MEKKNCAIKIFIDSFNKKNYINLRILNKIFILFILIKQDIINLNNIFL